MALRNRRLAPLALFLAMAVLHSWPLASDPAHLSRLDNDDAALNTWVIAWDAHVLRRQPLDLFEAPIFYPERRTLAYSEHMLVPAVMGAPLIWAGVSPVVVHNLLLIAGFALSGWSMWLLMTTWTGSVWAGVIAGLLYAFNSHSLTRFVHLQAQHVEFFPLMLYALDRVIVQPRLRYAVLLAAAFLLQALCSNYLLVFMTFAAIAAVAVRWDELGTPKKGMPAAYLLLAGVMSAIALAPFLWPYYEVNRDKGLARSLNEVALYSASWRDYLVTGGRLHYAAWSESFFGGRTALFPGITGMILAIAGVISSRGVRDPRIRMAIAVGVVGVALSFGTSLPGFHFLHEHLPLLNGLRNSARWGWLALAAIALLAGFGAAALEKRKLPLWNVVAAALCLLVTIEAIRTPVGYTTFNGIPRIYDRLAGDSTVILAEFPFFSGGVINLNGPYVLANTRYFKPLVNGYSGFQPASFEARGRVLETFPSDASVAALRQLRVTHVAVHTEQFGKRYGEPALKAIDTVPELQLEADEDGIRLYRLK